MESQQSDTMAANEQGHEKTERLWTRTQVGEVEVCWDEDHDGNNSKTNYDKVRKKSNNTPNLKYNVHRHNHHIVDDPTSPEDTRP